MPRLNKIGKLATTIRHDGVITTVRLYNTDIVTFDDTANTVTLNTGGFFTDMTRNRMNQTSNQFNLGFSVYAVAGQWFVNYNGKRIAKAFDGNTVTFTK